MVTGMIILVSNRSSSSVFMFSLGSVGTRCNCKGHPTILLSIIESKYMGVAMVACEVD